MKDIAGNTFDREVLIDGTDESFCWFENDSIIGIVGNGAAGSQGHQPRAAPAAQPVIHGVMMNQRGAPAAFGAETFGQHFYDALEFCPREISIGPGGTSEFKKFRFVPILAGSCGDNLLRENIERFFRNDQAIQFAATNATQQCGALHQFITAQRKDAALRQTAALVLGASDALQQRGDGTRRAKLANEINRTDVDPKLE